jgi:hypothetical protein
MAVRLGRDAALRAEHAVYRLVAGSSGGLAAGTKLGSSVIYTVAALSVFWLLARLNRQRTASGGGGKFTWVLAIISGIGFLSIAALMGAKPI